MSIETHTKYNSSRMENRLTNINISTNLPATPEERKALVVRLQEHITTLQAQIKQNNEDRKLEAQRLAQIQVLKLRIKLILNSGEISLVRLSHLQQIFKHYCTHVFRTGKYMTFERLQYQKLHMTMERFFVFLKDFGLLVSTIQGKQRQVLEKSNVITIFKKVSSSSRQLSFQEFIQSIQKLAVLFWDEKQGFNRKQQHIALEKERRRKLLQKRRKRKQGNKQQQNIDHPNQQQGKQQSNQIPPQPQNPVANNNQNDNLIQQMLQDQNLEDPNQEVRAVAQRTKQQNAIAGQASKAKKQEEASLLRLTTDQKIQYYYQLLDIDSLDSYRLKLSSLNLPIFQLNDNHIHKDQNKALSESKLHVAQMQEEERLQRLKAKMNEKKQKIKERPLPKPSNQKALKQQQNARRRREAKKQRQLAVKQTKEEEKKKQAVKQKQKAVPKIQYKQSQVNWQMLQKLTIDHLKLKQFNPNRFIAPSDDDHYFLEEYGARPRISSRLQARQRQSLSIVQSTKMRAEELERRQRLKDRGAQTGKKPVKQSNTYSRNKI